MQEFDDQNKEQDQQSTEQTDRRDSLPVLPRVKARVTTEVKAALERREQRLINNDPVFSEPLTPKAPEAPGKLVKGNIDTYFLIWALVLICFGALMQYSASAVYAEQKYDSRTYLLWRYIIFAALAIGISAFAVLFGTPWIWKLFAVGTYAVSILLLLAVLVVGTAGNGAQRWIDLGFITIQPSEIAKVAVVMLVALYMSKYEKEITSTHAFGGSFKKGFIIPMIIIGVICVLVMLERHISGLMIIGMLGLSVMFMGGTRLKWLAMFIGMLGVAGVLLILVSDYAQERVAIWLHIEQVDPLGAAWQTLQGLYAIGSGGFFGLGLGSSRQKFGYVSEPQNDFIFTIICEELGFIGAFALIALFSLLVWRGIKIGQNAPDKFCALTVWGLTFKIALQVAMNIAVVTNSMPNTGISLPFFSSGGTSLMIQIFEIAIILSISRYSREKKE